MTVTEYEGQHAHPVFDDGTIKSIQGSRQKFTIEEDGRLKELVAQFGTHSWKKVSALMQTRTTRQCRERYNNYLSPNVLNGPWTSAEDKLLVEKVQEMGQKWSKIVTFFNRRSDVNIKNRYALLVSKGLATPGVSFHHVTKNKNISDSKGEFATNDLTEKRKRSSSEIISNAHVNEELATKVPTAKQESTTDEKQEKTSYININSYY